MFPRAGGSSTGVDRIRVFHSSGSPIAPWVYRHAERGNKFKSRVRAGLFEQAMDLLSDWSPLSNEVAGAAGNPATPPAPTNLTYLDLDFPVC